MNQSQKRSKSGIDNFIDQPSSTKTPKQKSMSSGFIFGLVAFVFAYAVFSDFLPTTIAGIISTAVFLLVLWGISCLDVGINSHETKSKRHHKFDDDAYGNPYVDIGHPYYGIHNAYRNSD